MNGKELFNSIFLEEEEQGKFLVKVDYIYKILGLERDEPHIHFLSTKKVDNPLLKKRPGNPYDGCISLKEKSYFDHGPHVGRLPKKDWIFITSWLSNNTNYKYICELWNMSNGNHIIELPKDPNDIDFNPYK